jgi:hypothetical protein
VFQNVVSQFDTTKVFQTALCQFDTTRVFQNAVSQFDTTRVFQNVVSQFDTTKVFQTALCQFDTTRVFQNAVSRLDTTKVFQNAVSQFDTTKVFQTALSTFDIARLARDVEIAVRRLEPQLQGKLYAGGLDADGVTVDFISVVRICAFVFLVEVLLIGWSLAAAVSSDARVEYVEIIGLVIAALELSLKIKGKDGRDS